MLLEELPFEPGFRLMDGDLLNKVAAEPAYSVDNTVTATGTSQSTAYDIRATVTIITAGGDNAGVQLPFPKVGRILFIFNYTATGKRVYPFAQELINGNATADIPFQAGMMIVCTSNTSWAATQVSTDTSGDILLVASDADTATGTGHFVNVAGGAGGTTSGNGGPVTIVSGPATGNPGDAGDITLQGANSTSGRGGDIFIAGGNGATSGTVNIETTGSGVVTIGSATAATMVGGVLGVTGVSTFTGAAQFNGASTFGGAARFNGNAGFNNTAPIAKPTVTGAWAGNTAGKALTTALAAYGLVVDSTTA